jgi:hypothetical protein
VQQGQVVDGEVVFAQLQNQRRMGKASRAHHQVDGHGRCPLPILQNANRTTMDGRLIHVIGRLRENGSLIIITVYALAENL